MTDSNKEQTRQLLAAFFQQAYAPDSVSGGILQAIRPNESEEWSEEEDTKRSEDTMSTFMKDFDAAAHRLASR